MPIRCGVIGFGKSARTYHLPVLDALDEFEISAISTSRENEVRDSYPGIVHYAQAEDLIARSEIDMLIITSTNPSHYMYAKAALERGIAVVVEKPFTMNSRESGRLVRLSEKTETVLSVYQNKRWDGDFLTLKELIQEGKLGTISHFENHYDRFRPIVRDRWREDGSPGSGLLYDLGPHVIDQCLHLFGWPDWIQSDIAVQRKGGLSDDYIHIILAYGGMRCELHIGSLVNGPIPRYAIHGTGGSFIKYGMDQQEVQLAAGMNPFDPAYGVEEESDFGVYYPGQNEDSQLQLPSQGNTGPGKLVIPTHRGSYTDYYRQMARAVTGRAVPPVSALDGHKTMVIIEKARESARRGRRIPAGSTPE